MYLFLNNLRDFLEISIKEIQYLMLNVSIITTDRYVMTDRLFLLNGLVSLQ